MSRTVTRSVVVGVALALVTPLVTADAGASAPNAPAILARALADGARETSMTMSGAISESGVVENLEGGYSFAGTGGATKFSSVGTEYIIEPAGASYCFVKATSLTVLRSVLEVKSPKSTEIGVWYKVKKSNKRYASIASAGGAQTIAQLFSLSKIGWSRAATYEGTTVLKGVAVIKLGAASNTFVSGSGFGKTTLYVTDTAHPLPFAMTGPSGTTGLIYFSKWDATTVSIPRTRTILPK